MKRANEAKKQTYDEKHKKTIQLQNELHTEKDKGVLLLHKKTEFEEKIEKYENDREDLEYLESRVL